MKIYTDSSTSVDVTVSEGNKWYTYLLPKGKGLYKIVGGSVKKVVVKTDITTNGGITIIPELTVEASFKGSSTSNVTNMSYMFNYCSRLKSLDVSGFNTSKVTTMYNMFQICANLESLDLSNFKTTNVTDMGHMFDGCSNLKSLDLSGWNMSKVTDKTEMFSSCNKLKTIKMVGCSQETYNKIDAVKPSSATIVTE